MRLFQILTRCLALVAVLTLPICIVSLEAAPRVQPDESNQASSGYSAAALFNQANADARQGKPGPAILNYERALLLAPNDTDIAENLHFVRAKAGLPDTTQNWFSRSLMFARPNTLAWLGCIGLALAGTSLLVGRIYPQRRPVFRSLTFVGALLLVTAIAGAGLMWPKVNEAVVTARTASARTSPVEASEAAFELREGETVIVLGEHQEFLLAQTSAGRSGWVPRANLARVVPSVGKSKS